MSSPIYKPGHQNGQSDTGKMKVKNRAHISDQETASTTCGFWFFQPPWIQPCANIGLFTAFYSLAGLVTSTLTSYVTSQITTLERQFGFSSHQTGIIMAANDIGYIVCVLFVSYTATRLHIPRSLGVTTMFFGLSGIACSLPHFIFGASDSDPSGDSLNSTESEPGFAQMSGSVFGSLCDVSNATTDVCQISDAQKSASPALLAREQVATASLVIIVIGMIMQGFGKAPRSSFTITYLDDNTSKTDTGFYMGIVATVSMLGPALAFLMGGLFSKMYVTLQATTLTPRHPRWIGAWWLGYILFGLLALLVALPIFCFPRRLPKRASAKEVDEKETGDWMWNHGLKKNVHDDHLKTSESHPDHQTVARNRRFSPKFILRHSREFMATLFRLWTNPVYLCMVASGCLLVFTIGGLQAYGPKYLEQVFHLPAHMVNYILAGQVLCTSGIGTFVGGYLSKRLKMTAMKALKFVIVAYIISIASQSTALIFHCDQSKIHNFPSEENSCNKECNCKDNSYFPVCGGDGITYYSPCHAGCGQGENGMYHNCTCIEGGLATSGTCDHTCSHLYPYVVFNGIRFFFQLTGMIPKMIIFIRCVSSEDRPMAIGFSSFMVSLLGWLLGPIIFGNIIDGVCDIWDVKCGSRGRCLLYDNDLFRFKLHGSGFIGLCCSLAFICVAFVYARWTKCLDEPKSAVGEKETVAETTLIRNDGETDAPGPDIPQEEEIKQNGRGEHSLHVV